MTRLTLAKSEKDKNTGLTDEHVPASTDLLTPSRPHADIMDLQRTAGNQAVGQLLRAETSDLPTTAQEAIKRGEGQPLDPSTRGAMERRLGQDLNQVRVHTGAQAHESAQSVSALAFTVEQNIVFAQGQYRPETPEGQRLLEHEVVHTVQQKNATSVDRLRVSSQQDRYEREAEAFAAGPLRAGAPAAVTPLATQTLQRQTAPQGGAIPGEGEGIDLTFIIQSPDAYTRDVADYMRTTLQVDKKTCFEVENLVDIVHQLDELRTVETVASPDQPASVAPVKRSLSAGQRVRRIRIVAHGSEPGPEGEPAGQVKMKPAGESRMRWVTPVEVSSFGNNSMVKSIMKDVMSPGAVVEFWGCYVGQSPEALKAWSSVFGSRFTAPTDVFMTEPDVYHRRAEKGQRGEVHPGQPGTWVQVTSTSEIDSRNPNLKAHFRQWLLKRYQELVANEDILPQPNEDAQEKYMRDLFNRSAGDIKHLQIGKEESQESTRPGDRPKWMKLWQSYPVNP